MYNEETSAKILKVVVGQVSEETLEKIQQVIDEDKYRQCSELGYDLCGNYAAFCACCDKSLNYPCANAYIKDMKAETDVHYTENTENAENAENAEQCAAPVKIRIATLKRKKAEA